MLFRFLYLCLDWITFLLLVQNSLEWRLLLCCLLKKSMSVFLCVQFLEFSLKISSCCKSLWLSMMFYHLLTSFDFETFSLIVLIVHDCLSRLVISSGLISVCLFEMLLARSFYVAVVRICLTISFDCVLLDTVLTNCVPVLDLWKVC